MKFYKIKKPSLKLTAIFILFIFSSVFQSLHAFQENDQNPLTVYNKTMGIVKDQFYDQSFRQLPWDHLVDQARTNIHEDMTAQQIQNMINPLLEKLKSSHTSFYTYHDQTFYALRSIFSFDLEKEKIYHIGAWFEKIHDQWFIRNIFQGGPADRSGLLQGDHIIASNGKMFEPVLSFSSGKSVILKIKRSIVGVIKNYHK